MAQEQDRNQIPSTVLDFIASEMARRGLDRQTCKEKLLAEILADGEMAEFDVPDPPPMPPEGDPGYSIAIHGPRSEEHLLQVLEERRATKHLRVEVTPEFWEEKKRALAEKHGLRYP